MGESKQSKKEEEEKGGKKMLKKRKERSPRRGWGPWSMAGSRPARRLLIELFKLHMKLHSPRYSLLVDF